ncbi:NAD(P)-dependent oxidoreductase [Pseudoroseomonas sp. WGS1072]|uniref:NAD(P)-dependent oxidoreductase n=1 Tax=Roseomonas sp. WGS1072 TaxID=3366816 RepID=UPI003BF1CC5B
MSEDKALPDQGLPVRHAVSDRIGFIGLGQMGLPMACCLRAAGLALTVHDTAPDALERLAAAPGAAPPQRADSPAALAAGSDIVVLMLPSSPVVAAVLEGPGGLLDALRPGMLVIDMGSSLPGETRRLAERVAAHGAEMMDAPVSGSVLKASDGTLTIMAGGSAGPLARATPLLRHMGRTIIPTGAVGSAHAMKALNNYVYAAGLLASLEALRLGERLGLDLGVLTDVMNASSGRNVATETKLRQHVLSGGYAGGFQLGLMRKDLETAGSIAGETGYEARSLALCRAVWAEAMERLGPGADNTELHRLL